MRSCFPHLGLNVRHASWSILLSKESANGTNAVLVASATGKGCETDFTRPDESPLPIGASSRGSPDKEAPIRKEDGETETRGGGAGDETIVSSLRKESATHDAPSTRCHKLCLDPAIGEKEPETLRQVKMKPPTPARNLRLEVETLSVILDPLEHLIVGRLLRLLDSAVLILPNDRET